MLRNVLVTLGGMLIIAGVTGIFGGYPALGIVALVWGAILAIGIVYEHYSYKKIVDRPPGPDWQRTTERFVDNKSGKTVTVYLKPITGERAYVAEPAGE
jgi:hypothetical protein